ncbi:hypothetical protein Poli38472_014368 [Pythium oligandrum]|uniref:Uncharacterized protein n=1 Tax=Pythium oligandrum TaxID=41045 RepID=A0A8K1FBZ1_PYTOL|nr:hypothetical protein Poli38472_014368 [Pythium oligandrum]|eukprot:TMW57765.1 hypothetical protein Poli38472_014368 [Pythium oligandrum]
MTEMTTRLSLADGAVDAKERQTASQVIAPWVKLLWTVLRRRRGDLQPPNDEMTWFQVNWPYTKDQKEHKQDDEDDNDDDACEFFDLDDDGEEQKEATRVKQLQTLELMELLRLAASLGPVQMDGPSRGQHVLEHAKIEANWRRKIGFLFPITTWLYPEVVKELCAWGSTGTRSDQFVQAKASLVALLAETGRTTECVLLPPIRLFAKPKTNADVTVLKDRMDELVGVLERGHCELFRVDGLAIEVDNPSWTALSHLASSRLPVRDLTVRGSVEWEFDSCMTMPPPLARLVESKAVASSSTFGVKTLALSYLLGRDTFAAVCSALRDSQSVRSLSLSCVLQDNATDPVNRRMRWQWFAYAVLSTHATHRIRSLTLSDWILTRDDVTAVGEGLNSADPTSLLVQSTSRTTQSRVVVLPASWSGRLVPVSCGTDPFGVDPVDLFALPEPITVTVIDQATQDAWAHAIVPGIGLCKILREQLPSDGDATQRSAANQALSATIQTLELRFDEINGGETVVSDLLELFKRNPIRKLVISRKSVPLNDTILDPITSGIFPFVEDVKLRCIEMGSLDSLANLYTRGDRLIHSLELHDLNVLEDDSIERFFTVLSDANHPMTRRLDHLDLQFRKTNVGEDEGRARVQSERILVAAGLMLEKNTRLQTCILHVQHHRDFPELSDTFQLTNQRQYIVPFESVCKRAFLSVFRSTASETIKKQRQNDAGSTSRSSKTVPGLDIPLLALIFEFTSGRFTRWVHLAPVTRSIHGY